MAKRAALYIAICLPLLTGYAAISANGSADAKKPASRVVSFAPSNTELLYAIGASDRIIGVCSYCDYPTSVKSKTLVGNFISANLERLAGLKPDKIVLVSGQESLAGMLSHNGYQVSILKNDHLSDISKNLRQLAALTDNTARGEQVAATFDKCLLDFKTITSRSNKPAVFYCVWPQPLLTVGKFSYLTEAITACGGESISQKMEAGYPHFSMEKLVLANPDVIVMPYECKDHEFLKKHPWSSLKAVKNEHVYFLPDPPHDGLARPTLRLATGLNWLAKKIHPELAAQLDTWYSHTQSSLTATSTVSPTKISAGNK